VPEGEFQCRHEGAERDVLAEADIGFAMGMIGSPGVAVYLGQHHIGLGAGERSSSRRRRKMGGSDEHTPAPPGTLNDITSRPSS